MDQSIPETAKSVTLIVVLCPHVSQSVKHNLLAAFRHLLRPLVRIALRNGVLFPEFIRSVRDAYVKVASAELRLAGGDPSAEHAIAVMTGVVSGEVAEVLSSPDALKIEEVDERINAAVRVLLGWHQTGITLDLTAWLEIWPSRARKGSRTRMSVGL